MSPKLQFPNAVIALMRLNRPIGIWLLMWPCWWALAMATGGQPEWQLLGLFALGAMLMRSAGCIMNDLADREFDRQVARTRNRPLASGAITPYQAIMLMLCLLTLSLVILLQLHPNLFFWAAGSLVMIAAYPFMKRITYWPQAFLGLTFNLGALFGWIAVAGEPPMAAWLLYAAGFCWTMGYDTIYAHQDIEDDIKIGVKSTAIRFGRYSPQVVGGFYVAMLLLLALANWQANGGVLFYYALIPSMLQLGWQLLVWQPDHPTSCLQVFKSNHMLGFLVFLACMAS